MCSVLLRYWKVDRYGRGGGCGGCGGTYTRDSLREGNFWATLVLDNASCVHDETKMLIQRHAGC